MRCRACDGQGVGGNPDGTDWTCSECNGLGHVDLTGCPYRMVTADVWRAVQAAEYAAPPMSSWPVSGGWLDQTAIGLEAIELIQTEKRWWKRRSDSDG